MLIEGAESAGLTRASLLEPLGLTAADVVDPNVKVDWKTLTLILEQLSRLLDDDEDRLRDVGLRISKLPSYEPFRRLARAIVSVQALYDVSNRFMMPASFPHARVKGRFIGDRLLLRIEIPAAYAPSRAFFLVFEGSVTQLPTLLGLPPAVLVESRVTPRTCDLVLVLPRSHSMMDRLQRVVGVVSGASDALALLEEQHEELAENVEALQRARAELVELLDRLPDLVVVHASGRVLWANGAFLAVLGYELEEIVAKPLADFFVGSPGVLHQEPVHRPSSRLPALTEVTLKTRSEAEVIVEMAPTQQVLYEGVSARLLAGRDVTERKHMQQTLIIADRLASVGLLAAGVAHEVNNPLAYILNNIEIARRQLSGLGPAAEDSRAALGIALQGVDSIRATIRDLLMLARGDEGVLHAVDVSEVAQSTLALAAHEIDRTAKLVVQLQPGAAVNAGEGRIAQVLLNLVTNALEAMRSRPRGENELGIAVAHTPGGRVLIEVSDTGCGISDDHISRVFDPFFTTKPAGEGTGLGLSIAQRLVVEIGGEITASSVLGRGTTFRVLLPAVPAEATQTGPTTRCG